MKDKMDSRIWIGLFLLFCFPIQLLAQNNTSSENDEFADFRKELLGEYDDFRKDINAEYIGFLSQAWQEYRLFQGKAPDEMPKPLSPVLSQEEKNKRDMIVDVNVETKSLTGGNVPLIEKAEEKDLFKHLLGQDGDSLQLDFFGAALCMRYQHRRFSLSGIAENSIGNLWKDIADSRFTLLLADMLRYKQDMQMNDWAYFLLVKKVASRLSILRSDDSRTVFLHFLLVQSGYDARLARVDRFLVLLLPVREEVYARPYLEVDRKLYYVFSDKELKVQSNIFTYQLPEKMIQRPYLSLMIHKELRLPMQPKAFCIKAAGLEVKGEINLNKIRFYREYPSCELSVYASASPDAGLTKQLLASLSTQLSEKPLQEVLNRLLLWVQKGFRYQTDGEQFGYEKPFFIEENFYYPASDCEDRSILFAYLVNRFLEKEVILLDYPGHVATAVYMDKVEVKGTYIRLKGKKYIVCDPTYINAEIGQAMPSYKTMQPKVIRL